MGGDYRSYSDAPRVPVWKTNLDEGIRAFFRTGEAKHLIAAYKAHDEVNSSGFIQQLLDHKKLKEAQKEFPEIEYEVKIDIEPMSSKKVEDASIREYLDAFDFPATARTRFLKDAMNNVASGVNHFYGKEDDERLVVIEKGGGVFLKEKSQPLELKTEVRYQEVVMKRTEKRYPASMDQVLRKISEASSEGAQYVGAIRKEKGDAFVLDVADGRIYSMSMTRSTAKEHVQRQLELEYAGFVPGFKGFKKNDEEQIVSGMVDLTKRLIRLYQETEVKEGILMKLSPTLERKYDFVRSAYQDRKALPSKIGLPLEISEQGVKVRR